MLIRRNRCGLILKSNWKPFVWWRRLNQNVRFWLSANGWFRDYFKPLWTETAKYGRMKWENITPEMHERWKMVNWKRGCGQRYYMTEEQEERQNALAMEILDEIGKGEGGGKW